MYYQPSQKKAAAAVGNTRERDYWLMQLAGELSKAVFYYDYNDSHAGGSKKETITFQLTGDIFVRLCQLSRNSHHALHMILVAVLTLLLDKYTNLKDIILGSPIYRQEIRGEFINTLLALRNRVEDNMTFKEFLVQVRDTVTKAVENQNYPIEALLPKLNIEPSSGDFPLFDVLLLVENVHDKKDSQQINTNMIFSFLQTGEKVEGVIEYNPSLYEQVTIARIITHFTCLLQSVLANLDINLGSISILPGKEKEQLLFAFNNTRRALERDRCYHQLFEEQAARTPHRAAAIHGHRHLTYCALNSQANRLAVLLREKGLGVDHLAAVWCERSLEMLVALTAVFKAGGAYIPLELDYPPRRIKTILKDSEARILFTTPAAMAGPPGSAVYDEICSDTGVNHVIFPAPPAEAPPAGDLTPVNKPLDLSYVIYTSGTTGTPKGVMIHHRGMLNHLEAKINDLVITANDVIAQTASACFDISVWQFFAGLLTGGSTFIIDKESVLDPAVLRGIMQKGKITLWESVPSLLSAFLQLVEDKSEKEKELSHLRWMILTGEALGPHLVKKWHGYYPAIKVLNAYGPTEAADDVTHYVVQNTPAADRNPAIVPIGKPIQNTHIYILDRNLSLCPIGVRGEICVAGVGIGRGYWKDPDKTARAFIENPYSNEIGDPDYATLYKTGDLGYLKEDGNIRCLGRLDHQVKIRGFRIEPAEIENRLLKHAEITEAVVTVRTMFNAGEPVEGGQGSDGGNKYLCAYFVTQPGSPVSAAELREYLAGALPGYMVPSYFIRLERVPLTANGKIDREALPAPGISVEKGYIAPRSKIENRLVEIWAEVLDLEKAKISIDANFFQLGGHSLKAVVMIAKIEKELNVKLPLAEVFKTPHIKGLSGYIRGLRSDKYTPVEPVEKKEYYVLSSAQRRLYIIQQMDVNSTVYNMPMIFQLDMEIPGVKINKEKLEHTITRLIRQHESFRTYFNVIDSQTFQGIRQPQELNFQIKYYNLKESGPGETSFPGMIENVLKEFVRPFDLTRAPLVRVGVVITKQDRYILLVDMHHIISDLVSHFILERDFILLLKGEELPPLRLQYKEYAEWLNSSAIREDLHRQEKYWLEECKGKIPLLRFPVDYKRKKELQFEGDAVSFIIDRALSAKIRAQARQLDVTVMMYLFSVYHILIARYSGQDKLVVGTVAASRQHVDLENIIGFFVNLLPIKTNPHLDKRFSQFLAEVKEKTIKAYENQGYPFDELVSKLDIPREPGTHPLVSAVFAFQNQRAPVIPRENNRETTDFTFFNTARFDLMLHAVDDPDEISMVLQYPTALFKKSTIREFTDFYLEILSQAVKNPGIKLREIKMNLHLMASSPGILQDSKDDWDL